MTKTILQIIPALGTGGAEQACVDIAVALCHRGDKALVVSSGGRRVEEVQDAGGVHFRRDVATKNPVRIIRNAFWLAKVIKEYKVDVVHARSRAPAWTAYLACKMTGCRYVTTFHAAYKFSSSLKLAYNRVMARGDLCIAISPFVAAYMRDNYRVPDGKIRLVNRGIDMEKFAPTAVPKPRTETLRGAWGLKADDFVILLPARLSPIKNHELIIQSLMALRQKGKKLPVVCFVGDDQGRVAYSMYLQALIEKEDLIENVKLVGACADMPAALSLASLVVMPSKIPEGFGRVPVEAMAMGVPVIASNLGATQATVLEGQTGWLLPPDDPAKWADAIERAMAMPVKDRKKMAKKARAHVILHFTNEAMVAQTLAVYDELIPTNG